MLKWTDFTTVLLSKSSQRIWCNEASLWLRKDKNKFSIINFHTCIAMAGFSRSSSITYNFLVPFVQDLVCMKLCHISETDNEYGKGFQKKKKSPKKPWLEQTTQATQLLFGRSEGVETLWSVCGGVRGVTPHPLLLMVIRKSPCDNPFITSDSRWMLAAAHISLLLIGLETERSNP